jgi:hypothetical protein
MIIRDFYVARFTLDPRKANSVLVVDADTVLTFAVFIKCFQPITWRREQITQVVSVIQVNQFASRGFLNRERQFARDDALENSFCFRVSKRFNHTPIVSHNDTSVKKLLIQTGFF